jgi:hypothetical protein
MAITTDISKLPRGVRKIPHGYKARIEIADREYSLGTYDTPQDAELAYLGAKALRGALLVGRDAQDESRRGPLTSPEAERQARPGPVRC